VAGLIVIPGLFTLSGNPCEKIGRITNDTNYQRGQ